ncbi:DNA primase large subunit [Nomia melanderi]|uniref:DNA primase large subunit n=1 Tax=Nomia melanderi TaxID=2448451 RepID=UPI001304595C|nr:DNA primase large subunit-like [Nomia melanderi]
MEYTKRRRYTVNAEANDLQEIYNHDLQMYDFPPSGEIPFVEFQQLGMERLKLLQHVENTAVRTDLKIPEERKQNLSTALGKDGLKYFVHLLYGKGCKSPTETDLQCRKKDHFSHYIMRLSYCQEPDRQMWFINQEVELFKLRFSSLDPTGVLKLLSIHNIECQQITREEKDELREELHSSTSKVSNIDTSEFYKVPFQKVIDLIRSRRVYVANGIAYIPQIDLVSLFVSYFRKSLIDGMEYAKNYLVNISDDERLMSFLKSLPGSFSGMTRVVWTTNNTPVDKLDELSKTSYPLCMRTLHEALRTHHHLRNSGRIQYGLFIKGIGVTMEDTLRFWRTEFTKKIDPDKFEKQYSYTVRHMFGKEGKQTNYTPLGCTKIITSSVGPGDYHGCPYRHMDTESLRQKLCSYGIPATNINEIADLSKHGHYLIACTKYFEVLHTRLPDKPIIHPNGYFVESRAILAKDESTEHDSQEKFSQSGRFSERLVSNTPTRRDRNIATPSRNIDRSIGTPSRIADKSGSGTPLRKVERTSMTPSRATRATPKRLDTLEIDEITAQLMCEDM